MPIGSLGLLLAVAGLAFVNGRLRRRREWQRLAMFVVGGVVVDILLVGGVNTRFLFPRLPIFDVLAAIVGLLILIDIVGTPLPIARRFGLGLHSRAWEFDGRLFRLNEEARALVKGPHVDAERTRTALSGVIRKISALRPPDRDWMLIRDGWVDAWQRLSLLFDPSGEKAAWDDALALQSDLIERTERLRADYRAHASRILGEGP